MEISIQAALLDINGQEPGSTFELGWIRYTGVRRVQLKRITCRLAGMSERKEHVQKRRTYQVREKKLLQLIDMATGQRVTAPIYTIKYYNGAIVRH